MPSRILNTYLASKSSSIHQRSFHGYIMQTYNIQISRTKWFLTSMRFVRLWGNLSVAQNCADWLPQYIFIGSLLPLLFHILDYLRNLLHCNFLIGQHTRPHMLRLISSLASLLRFLVEKYDHYTICDLRYLATSASTYPMSSRFDFW